MDMAEPNVFILRGDDEVGDDVGNMGQPTTPKASSVLAGWPFDNTMCKMSGLVQGMSVSASVFTLVAIAVERYVGVGGS